MKKRTTAKSSSKKVFNMKDALADPQKFSQQEYLESFKNKRTKQVVHEIGVSGGHMSETDGIVVPLWVQNAWNEFFKSSGITPKSTMPELAQVGYMLGAIQGIQSFWEPSKRSKSDDAKRINDEMISALPQIRNQAAALAPREAAEFFDGQRQGFNQAAKIMQLSQRVKVLMVLAVAWELVNRFKSTGELFRWLMSLEGKGGRLLAPATDSRDIRKLCREIGLRFESKGGRPPKKTRP